MPIAQRVAAAANGLRAADTAFAMDAQRISYGELARRAAAVAAGLASATPARRREWMPGDARLLAIGTGNHPTFAELFVGATAGDGACAVLDPQWAPEQAAAILRRLRPDVLVVAGTRSGLLETSTRLGIPTLVMGHGRNTAHPGARSTSAWSEPLRARRMPRRVGGLPQCGEV